MQPNCQLRTTSTMLYVMQSFVVMLALVSGMAQADLSPEDRQRIDDFIEQVMECVGIPGLSLAGVQNDQAVLTQGYGKANVEQGADVDGNTLFGIASSTKAFFGALVTRVLSQTESYGWSTPVREILGEGFHFYSGYLTNHTTFRDLLNMKAGFPGNDMIWLLDNYSMEDLFERARFFEPESPLRTTFRYNNLMFSLPALALEAIRGATWEDLMESELFDPIGMTGSTFIDRAPADYEGFATPYVRRSDEIPLVPIPIEMWQGERVAGPSGSIATSAVDVAKWLQFLLNNATTQEGEQLLTPEQFQDYMRPEFSVDGIPSNVFPYSPVLFQPNDRYANGWYTGYYKGYALWSHAGYAFGYQAMAHILPGGQVGSFLMVNHDQYNPSHDILAFVDDILLGEEPWFTAEDVCNSLPQMKESFQSRDVIPGEILTESRMERHVEELHKKYDQKSVARKIRPSLRVESYVGRYGNFAYGNVTIFVNETTGGLEMLYGNLLTFDLTLITDDVFLPTGKPSPGDLLPVGVLDFSSSQGDGIIDVVDWLGIEATAKRFIRDLGLADAPPPNIDSC